MAQQTLLLLVGLPGSGKSRAELCSVEARALRSVGLFIFPKVDSDVLLMSLLLAPPLPPALLPAGKSTLAQLFQQQGWTVINQDQLGDRKACEAACWQALSAGQSVSPAPATPLRQVPPVPIPLLAVH